MIEAALVFFLFLCPPALSAIEYSRLYQLRDRRTTMNDTVIIIKKGTSTERNFPAALGFHVGPLECQSKVKVGVSGTPGDDFSFPLLLFYLSLPLLRVVCVWRLL